MPHVEGESLRDWLNRETQLPVTDAVELARKVADALDYAHGRGVIHRDFKPTNIMLSERGDPLVADFGIALAVSQAGGGCLTETGLSLGTPHYMSPEQALADRQVDPAATCIRWEPCSTRCSPGLRLLRPPSPKRCSPRSSPRMRGRSTSTARPCRPT